MAPLRRLQPSGSPKSWSSPTAWRSVLIDASDAFQIADVKGVLGAAIGTLVLELAVCLLLARGILHRRQLALSEDEAALGEGDNESAALAARRNGWAVALSAWPADQSMRLSRRRPHCEDVALSIGANTYWEATDGLYRTYVRNFA
jgi:hypothetical protein